MALAAAVAALALAAPPPEGDLRRRAEDLVARLGAPRYLDRERAARDLLALGFAARDAVLAGQRSADSEISDRCVRLYPVLWRADLERRVRRLLDDPDGPVPDDLPGAAAFLKRTGDGPDARRLYATMVRAHPDPLLEVELHPERLRQVYPEFIRAVHARANGPAAGLPAGVRAAPPESEVLLFLFLGAVGEVRTALPPGVSSTYIYSFLNAPPLAALLGGDPPSAPARRLFAAWMEKERYTIALRRGIEMAAQHRVRECAEAVLKTAADKGTLPSVRATALLGLARLGTRDDLPHLVPFLKDDLQVSITVVNGERATVQMRDVALAAAAQLAGQNPSDFGFERRAPAGLPTVSYIYFAFTTDEKRAAAHARWAEWAAANLKK